MRRKLVLAEVRRLGQSMEMLHPEEAATLVGALHHSVRRHVPDQKTRQAIAADIEQLLDRDGPGTS